VVLKPTKRSKLLREKAGSPGFNAGTVPPIPALPLLNRSSDEAILFYLLNIY